MKSKCCFPLASLLLATVVCAFEAFGENQSAKAISASNTNGTYQYSFPENRPSNIRLNKSNATSIEANGGWLQDRLSVGLGVTTFNFTRNHREADIARKHNFIGAVNDLHEVRDTLLTPVIGFRANDYLKFELSYIDITASTENFNSHVGDGHVQYNGPSLALEGTYPLLDGKLIPHAGIGMAFLWGDFEEDTWWHLGYSSFDGWEYYGRTQKTRMNYFREIYVDEFATPIFFNLGLTYRFTPDWSIDFTARHMNFDPDCEWGYRYTRRYEQHNIGDFDLSHFAYTLSVSYTF